MPSTRRELLRLGLGGSTLLACGMTVPAFLARSARALADDPKRADNGRILVVLQLDGGNDGLNTVVPHGDDLYYKNRPKLALKRDGLKPIDDHLGLHPTLENLSKRLEDGRLAIVQSVGYPNPNRSHFESMAIWNTARLDPAEETPGWLSRALEARSSAPGQDAPALHIADEALPQALRGGRQHVPSLASAEQFRLRLGVPEPAGASGQRRALDRIAALASDSENPLLPFIARGTLAAYTSSARIEEALNVEDTGAKYPDFHGLARHLRLVARLIRSGLSTTLYYAHLGGFDTHSDQLGRHEGLLRELDQSLQAFLDDLDRSGEAGRVAVLVFSEFGRRLQENASAGTDHGTAAPVFVLGQPVLGGVKGPYPDLADLDDGDPKHAVDFRRIYASLLDDWLGLPSSTVLGGRFERLPLVGT